MKQIINLFILPAALASGILGGCARVAVEGGDKPIHIVLDINIRVDQALDRFFAFEEQIAPKSTEPANAPASTQPATGRSDENQTNESRGDL